MVKFNYKGKHYIWHRDEFINNALVGLSLVAVTVLFVRAICLGVCA